MEEHIYTVETLSNLLGLSERTIRGKANDGELPAYKKWGKWFFLKSEIIEQIKDKSSP